MHLALALGRYLNHMLYLVITTLSDSRCRSPYIWDIVISLKYY